MLGVRAVQNGKSGLWYELALRPDTARILRTCSFGSMADVGASRTGSLH
jgi:hypothetical protein